ncbi:MAG: thioredoxin [Gemmataceae bacterium]|nr:thioredoxin [Gemmataceae bacterium]
MSTDGRYEDPGPTREEIDSTRGQVVLEFGADWCGYCQTARPLIEAAALSSPGVRHVKVADGPGRPLGRSFRVKLWPTLVFLRDGQEVARVVRPKTEDEVRRGFEVVGIKSESL